MNKFELTHVGNKIIKFEELDESEIDREYFDEAFSFQEVCELASSRGYKFMPNQKIGISYNDKNEIKEISILPSESNLPRQYIFDTIEQAQDFSDSQDLDIAPHLQPPETKIEINNFFSGEKCSFKGYKKLYGEYQKAIEKAGGASCTACAKKAIINKYQKSIIKILKQ